MSRIGKAPISLPQGVSVTVASNNLVTVKGPKGEISRMVDPDITVQVDKETNHILVQRPTDQKRHRALHGLYRALIHNMVVGVSEGFKKTMEIVGVGYKATVNGQIIDLSLGFSHNLFLELPKEVKASATAEKGKNPTLTLESFDKELLGMVCAKIRSYRKPEPYKGKGIKFEGEVLRRKAGKSAASAKK
ncbi:MAG: 50S ribosomal protein L6 [Bacteroidales bacterium]|nr:50S ribosomal protein L6 [Bacteroidales bacterium]MDE6631336.1 50S ribosomal protein L6 [Bacteroidales bacterium]MDE7338774.1 50S ribosomal protein L6 [Bacteroidales bacterium]